MREISSNRREQGLVVKFAGSARLAGFHNPEFCGTWLRFNSLERNGHCASLCLTLRSKNHTPRYPTAGFRIMSGRYLYTLLQSLVLADFLW